MNDGRTGASNNLLLQVGRLRHIQFPFPFNRCLNDLYEAGGFQLFSKVAAFHKGCWQINFRIFAR